MATELHDRLTYIYEEKNEKILPENIKKGIKIFDVEGVADVLDTSDANATASDLLQGKSAYVQGTKIEGTIPSIETLTIKPELETEKTTEYNSKVGSVTVPSLIDMASAYSEPAYKAGSIGGGPRAASCSATVNTVPGGTIVMCLLGRAEMTFSTPGWNFIFRDNLLTSEGYTQYIALYTKQATGTSEALTCTGSYSERCAVCLLSFDSLVEYETIWSFNSSPNYTSRINIPIEVQPFDIFAGQGFWGGTVSYGGPGSKYYNRCSDGGRLGVYLCNGTSTSAYMSCDSSQASCFVARMKVGLNTDDIRKGKKFLGMMGTFTEDADATAADIMTGKTAYVNGVKVVGDIATLGEEVQVSATDATVSEDNTKFIISSETPSSGVLSKGATYQITADGQQVMDALSLAPDMLRSGVNILGVEGTYGADVGEFTAKYEPAGRTSGLSPQVMITTIQAVNMEGVTDATNAFYNLWNLKSLPEMNLSSVTSMNQCFYNCSNVIYAPDYEIPKVGSMFNCFYNCDNLKTINLSNSNSLWNIVNAFAQMNNLTTLPKANYNFVNVATQAFKNDINLSGIIDLSGFTRSGSPLSYTTMFYGCNNITGIEGFNKQGTAHLYTNSMFYNCQNLKTVNNCNFFNLNGSCSMFHNCINLTSITNSGFSWVAQNVSYPNFSTSSMFENCSNLVTLDNNFWLNAYWFGMNKTFAECVNLVFPEHIEINSYGYNYNSSYGMLNTTFGNCRLLKSVTINFTRSQPTGAYWDRPAYFTNTFNGCSNLHSVNITNGTCSNQTNLISGEIFCNCNNLQNINIHIRAWNTSTGFATSYFAAGSGITSINNLNITGANMWNSSACYRMFHNCTKLRDLGTEYLNFWNSKSGNGMFQNCFSLTDINYNQININAMTDIGAFFAGMGKKTDLMDWIFPNVTYAGWTFGRLNLPNIYNIQLPKVTTLDSMFEGAHINTVHNIYAPLCVNGVNLFEDAHINNIKDFATGAITNAMYMFRNADIGHIDMPNFTTGTLSYGNLMFENSNIMSINWNAKPTTITYGEKMFSNIRGIEWMHNFNMPTITYGNNLFDNCRAERIHNITINIGTYGYNMFKCLDINNGGTKIIEDVNLVFNSTGWGISNCFAWSYGLTTLRNISWLNQVNLMYLCQNSNNLTTVDGINAPTANNCYYMFANCTNLRTVTNLNIPLVASAYGMFYQCRNLTTPPALNYNQFTQIGQLFYGCTNLTTLPFLNCKGVAPSGVQYGIPNLTDIGGFMNLGNIYWNYSRYHSYCNFYLNAYPKLTQQAIFNVVNTIHTMSNYQYIFLTNTQNNLLDDEHRKILTNKRWSVYRVNDPA